MRVIFSCENTPYMRWQAEFLHYSYCRTGMQSQLTALVSITEEPLTGFTCETFSVANYKECIADQPYVPLNKPGSIAEWAASDGPGDETVLLVDADSAFIRPVEDPGPLRRGEAYADVHDFMHDETEYGQVVLRRHCRPELLEKVQPVGIYILARRDDLAEVAPLWLQKSIDIRSDSVCAAALPGQGWLSEMFGYTIAAAECGIWHHFSELAQITGSQTVQRPIIHYCLPVNASGQAWYEGQQEPVLWSKWDYQPWEHPPLTEATSEEARELLFLLADLAACNRARAQANSSSLDM